jgi:amino acid adenylation domain-containing protein/non-ribosomal peptide synthase protein (TIGR01720 family)
MSSVITLPDPPGAETLANTENYPVFPVSFAQKRLWFLEQLEPGPLYNVTMAARLKGPLDERLLQKSLEAIVLRHEPLRTTFRMDAGEPVQVIAPQAELPLPLSDLTQLPQGKREAAAEALAKSEALKPFDLSKDLMLRVRLIRLAPEEHILTTIFHHIASDGWSIGVFFREWAECYEAFQNNVSPALPELAIQYADYAVWQREWLQGEVLAEQLDFWKKQFAGAPSLLELPTDFPRPAVQSHLGAKQPLRLNAEVTARLRSLAQREGGTLFMVLAAGLQSLLHRYSGQTDIVIGAPIANRNRAEIEGLLGCFINTLALRSDLSNDPLFRNLLRRVRETTLAAYEHQDLPFEKLVDELHPERNQSFSPLFQTMLVLQNTPAANPACGPLRIDPFEVDNGTTKFDLTLFLWETAEGLTGWIEYASDLFKPDRMARMAGHFQTLLEGIAANPDQNISRLPLLTPAEQRQILVEWNDNRLEYEPRNSIQEYFEEQAKKQPDAVAVVFENERVTFAELNARANQLANYLRKQGIGPEVLAGICVERTIQMVVAMLAVVKAGGAYVPLDPVYPKDRLGFILEDARAPILLTQSHLVTDLPASNTKVICLDKLNVSNESAETPSNGANANNLAYVIFTSGSTGRPKGVAIEHRSGIAFIEWARTVYSQDDLRGVLFSTSICFDLSIYEVFATLGFGGKIIIAENALHLPNLPARDEVILLNTVPSAIAELLRMKGIPPSVRIVNLAGEPLQQALVEKLYQIPTIEKVYDLYGPTEDTTYSTFTLRQRGGTPTIGRPLANSQAYLLDANKQPVPVGIPGELYLAGAGLARGYLHRPDLTAERFVPNPFSSDPAAQMYKTGDLIRYRSDGNLEYVGRIDHQVKIRGFRIELGEIEAVLRSYPGVREVVVVARQDNPGEKRLVAYLATTQPAPTVGDLRSHIKQKLPDYMVPAAMVFMPALPLTPNGKVDRKALPAPDQSRPDLGKTCVAPQNDIEKTLVEIWSQVLRLEKIGTQDNFFELGGDSILSIQIISRANQAGIRLTPKQLFQNQTIAELARVAQTAAAPKTDQGLVTGPVLLTPIQRWFFDQNFANPHHWNQAVFTDINSPINLDFLNKSINGLVLHHDALRLRFAITDTGWQQEHVETALTPTCEKIDLSNLPEPAQEEAIRNVTADAQASLNITNGPVLKAVLFDLGTRPARLLIAIHHLVVDGVSWRILLEDLDMAYRQLSEGKPIQLPNKVASFKDWSERLAEYAQSAELIKEAENWKAITSVPAKLPLDFADGKNFENSTRTISISLTDDETRSLLQDVPSAYNTQINDVLLAALGSALASWTNQKSVLVNLEGHGREDLFAGVDISRTVGWFTTLFPVRLDIGESQASGELLKSIKEQLRAIPNHGLGFGVLRYLSKTNIQAPTAQIVFNYLGQFDQSKSLFSLRREVPEPLHSPSAHRPHLLEINGSIIGGRLQLDWGYNINLHRPETIQKVAENFATQLRELIRHCANVNNRGRTPSDFPLAKITQRAVDQLFQKYPALDDTYPLSPMQKLFHTLASGGSEIGFEQFRFTFEGNLNIADFEQAWKDLIQSHSILRTAFAFEGLEEPLQVVSQNATISLTQHDWRPISNQEEEMEKFLRVDSERGFDLTNAPLMRLNLIQTGEQKYEFIWSFHHILFDGWSWPLVFEEVSTRYERLMTQNESPFPRASRPYRDYIAWLKKQDLDAAQRFWTDTLKGFTSPTPLAGYKRSADSALHKPEFKETEFRLRPQTASALQAWARNQMLTLSGVLEGAWGLVLSGGCGKEDVVFGAAVSGRSPEIAGVESMVGLFINNLPRRVQVNPKETISVWLKELQAKELAAREFEYTPLVQIQKWSQVPLRQRLFDSLVLFQNYQMDSTALSRLGSEVKIPNFQAAVHTSYPITLMVVPGNTEFLLKIIYDGRLFEAETVSGFLSNLKTVLETIEAEPEALVGTIINKLPKNNAISVDSALSTIGGKRQIVEPRDDVEVQLKRIWERVLGVQPIGVTENFFDLGGHSLPAVWMFEDIKKLYGRSLPMVTLFQAPTIEKLAQVLRQEGWEAPWSSLVAIKASGTKPPFYCVHGVGGNILEYLDLAKYMAADQPFYGLQMAGLDGKHEWHKSVAEMAAHYIKEIKSLQPEGPYYIGGSSFGGLVAYEMAQQFERSGDKVGILALFDTHAPGYPKELPAVSVWKRAYNSYADRIELHWGNLMEAKGVDRWNYIWTKIEKWYKGKIVLIKRTPRRLKQRVEKLLMPREIRKTRKAGFMAMYDYTPVPYAGRATLFRATEQPKGTIPERELGWGTLVQGGIEIYDTPGHHGAIVRDPRAKTLSEQLLQALQKARKNNDA